MVAYLDQMNGILQEICGDGHYIGVTEITLDIEQHAVAFALYGIDELEALTPVLLS